MRIVKYIAVLMITVLLLCGCGISAPPALPTPKTEAAAEPVQEPVQAQDAGQEESEAPQEEIAPSAEISGPQVLIKILDHETQRFFAPDDSGRLILSYLCEKPRVEISDNEQASDRINEYLSDLEEEYYSGEKNGLGNTLSPGFNKLLEKAYDNYQIFLDYKTDIKLDFEFSHYVEISRCDSKVICLNFKDFMDTGDNEKASREYSVIFDTDSGEVIRLEENDRIDDILQVVSGYLPAGMKEIPSAEGCDYLLSNYGLTITLPADPESAEGADGSQITVPYSAFSELGMDLFEPDGHSGSGTLRISGSPEADSDLSIIDSVSGSGTEETVFLIVDGEVYDFGILSIQYSNFDEKFYPKSTLWYSNHIADSRIQLSVSIPEGMPDLMIRYICEGNQYEQLITRSGMDGEIELTDLSIKAVG